MPAQDDARERQIIDLFNLERPADRVRHGTDAILTLDGNTHEFELKSVTTIRGGLSTVRDLGPDHIEKWRNKHWIVAYYDRGLSLLHCKYLTPDDMAPWIEAKWNYIKADFLIADTVPEKVSLNEMQSIIGAKDAYSREDARKLHKAQLSAQQYREAMDLENGYSAERMLEIFRLRVGYLLRRGSTLNNPHIPEGYLAPFEPIRSDHAAALRAAIRAWSSNKS